MGRSQLPPLCVIIQLCVTPPTSYLFGHERGAQPHGARHSASASVAVIFDLPTSQSSVRCPFPAVSCALWCLEGWQLGGCYRWWDDTQPAVFLGADEVRRLLLVFFRRAGCVFGCPCRGGGLNSVLSFQRIPQRYRILVPPFVHKFPTCFLRKKLAYRLFVGLATAAFQRVSTSMGLAEMGCFWESKGIPHPYVGVGVGVESTCSAHGCAVLGDNRHRASEFRPGLV